MRRSELRALVPGDLLLHESQSGKRFIIVLGLETSISRDHPDVTLEYWDPADPNPWQRRHIIYVDNDTQFHRTTVFADDIRRP